MLRRLQLSRTLHDEIIYQLIVIKGKYIHRERNLAEFEICR